MELKIVLHQASFEVGNLAGNAKKILDLYSESQGDLVVFPELSLTGYNCQDLFLNVNFISSVAKHIDEIAKNVSDKALIIGAPTYIGGKLFNSAILMRHGKVELIYHKHLIPSYGVFDEKRYFNQGERLSTIFQLNGCKVRLMICEDIWHSSEKLDREDEESHLTLVINGSPNCINKSIKRINVVKNFAEKYRQRLVIYLNTIGGQDHLVFDGGSIVLIDGEITMTKWREGVITVSNNEVTTDFSDKYNMGSTRNLPIGDVNVTKSDIFHLNYSGASDIYNGAIMALRNYAHYAKCDNFVIGLSGGIDSALVAVMAVDAFGPENVLCVAMPSQYSSQGSIDDAKELVARLKCKLEIIPITDIKSSFKNSLRPILGPIGEDELTNENLQPRIRATILMAIANKKNCLLLCTSNKSESAVGYTTIYGDMTGAYGPIVDFYKTQVYSVARWRNELSDVIPEIILMKEPSAELRPNQADKDSLPQYEVLDKILYNLIELGSDPNEFDCELVTQVKNLIYNSEFKRFQSPPGPKVNCVMLTRDRRYPICMKF